MNVKRFLGLGLFTYLMCWAAATGFASAPMKLSPVVQTSPRITVQMYTPSEVVNQLYPPVTTTVVEDTPPYYEENIIVESVRDLPCAQWFNTAINAGWPNDPKVLKRLSFIMWRESRCVPTACSTSHTGHQCADFGLIQANYAAHHKWWADMGLTPDDMFDPYTNLHFGWLLYSGREAKGQCGWQPWRLC